MALQDASSLIVMISSRKDVKEFIDALLAQWRVPVIFLVEFRIFDHVKMADRILILSAAPAATIDHDIFRFIGGRHHFWFPWDSPTSLQCKTAGVMPAALRTPQTDLSLLGASWHQI